MSRIFMHFNDTSRIVQGVPGQVNEISGSHRNLKLFLNIIKNVIFPSLLAITF